MPIERLRRRPRELEPRTHVGDHEDLVSQSFPHEARALALIGEREEGVGMRVVDEPAGEERVRERLERRRAAPNR